MKQQSHHPGVAADQKSNGRRPKRRSELTRSDLDGDYLDDRPVLFRKLCHGIPSRSFFVGGHPVVLCARCFMFYVSIPAGIPLWFLIVIFSGLGPLWVMFICAASVIPMALDGLTQYHGLRDSSNTVRAVTGALAGAGSGLALMQVLFLLFIK